MIIPAIMLVLIVNIAPLALGSDRPLLWGFNAAASGVLLLLTVLVWSIKWREAPYVLSAPIAWPLALFFVALSWIAFQILPLKAVTIAHPIWSETSTLLAEGSKPIAVRSTISVSPSDTIKGVMNFLAVLAIALSAYIIGRGSGRANFLLNAFVVSATAYGFYGLYRLSTRATQILWFDQENNGFLTATFMNRNHAATYFGLAMLASFALLSREWRHAVADEVRVRERARRLIESLSGKLGVYIFFFASLLVTLLLTGSRAGISAALVGLAALIFLQHLRARQTQFGGGAASLSGALLGLFVLLAIFEMSGAKFAERLLSVDTAEEGRFGLWSDTITAISDHLWMGSGFGTFQDVFPLYRSAAANSLLWDKAHNDYLELFLTLGVPAALLILAAFLLIVGRCLKGVFERRRHAIFPLVAVAVALQVGLHALFDFSLQIQAVSLAFAMLLGVGLSQSYSESAS